ncbi:MAG: hypothetical protein ACR2O4_17820 [Hyphomicrobiaceae bacterium]
MERNPYNGKNNQTPQPRMSQKDFNTMAVILESRHGIHAKDMAEFFASVHARLGDAERCWAWGGVASMVKKREQARLDGC